MTHDQSQHTKARRRAAELPHSVTLNEDQRRVGLAAVHRKLAELERKSASASATLTRLAALEQSKKPKKTQ